MLTTPVQQVALRTIAPGDSIVHRDDKTGRDLRLLVDEVTTSADGVKLSCWRWESVGKGRRVVVADRADLAVARLPRPDEYVDIVDALLTALEHAQRYEKEEQRGAADGPPVLDETLVREADTEAILLYARSRVWRIDIEPAPKPNTDAIDHLADPDAEPF